MKSDRKNSKAWLGVACLVWAAAGISLIRAAAATNTGEDEGALASAICPVVYPVDQTPGGHGYQYAFYGNGFFISREGYLITAAHVLHSFRDGGQPYILVTRSEAPPTMLKAEVVAVDAEHDVAVLRATPNPFAGSYRVGILSLGTQTPERGEGVVVAALRPSRRQPRSFETELQDHSAARVVDYQSSQLEKGMGDTELLLFNHEVILGQSGIGFTNGAGGDFSGCGGADSLCHCGVAGEGDCLGRCSGERGSCCGPRSGDGKVLGCARNVQRIFDRRAFVGLLDFTISEPELKWVWHLFQFTLIG
jgi:hypothetical protein